MAALELSIRVMSALKAAGIATVRELVVHSELDMLKYRNFGKKSLVEIEELLNNKGLTFGMDLAPYKLEEA